MWSVLLLIGFPALVIQKVVELHSLILSFIDLTCFPGVNNALYNQISEQSGPQKDPIQTTLHYI